MNREETLALWEQGPEAWNAWAQEMLKRADKGTGPWADAAKADFSDHSFHTKSSFGGIVFPGEARFEGAKFRRACYFRRTMFHDDVHFSSCTFADAADFFDSVCVGCVYATFINQSQFDEVLFKGEASFSGASFLRGTSFSRGAEFGAAADFSRADFRRATDFGRSRFLGPADFRAIRSEGSFDMAGATFRDVPNFIQANFAEAPRLDNVTIDGSAPHTGSSLEAGKDGDELPARWRALKRLALQGHDHIREQEYFAEELKALKRDKHKGISAGAILLYEIVSDFGRSMVRPLTGWALLTFFFWWLYLLVYFAMLGASAPSLACSSAGAALKATLLSLHKGLPFTGIGSPDKLNQIYACLYGIRGGGSGEVPDRFIPVIPDLVYFFGIVQTLFSLVLIFLFLLALRNHFRIR